MASAAQVLANQANAKHSTGPKSAEGKVASSRNAVRHGLSSPFTVLAHEDQDEFNELLDCLTNEHQPANPHQAFLIDQLAISTWNLARAHRLQNHVLQQLALPEINVSDPDSRIVARMLEANPNALTAVQRYAAQAERSYYQAYRELIAAKQIQGRGELVRMIDSKTVQHVMNAPTPDHPLYASQYGNPKPGAQNKPNPTSAAQNRPPVKPSLRSQMPDNLALCL